MASKLLGRVPCVEPSCGFPSAHIKVNIDVEGKRPYRHCPECGAQYFPRTDQQVRNMMSTMREEGAVPDLPDAKSANSSAGSPSEDDATAKSAEDPVTPQKYKIVFGCKVPV